MNFNGKTVLLVGMGVSGVSAARWLAARGAQLRCADSREAPPGREAIAAVAPAAEMHCGPFANSLLEKVSLIVISPGVSLQEALLQEAAASGLEIVGDVELFARELHERLGPGNLPVLAITGSNGKTTVTTMVGDMCRAAGKNTIVAGNIGLPVLDTLPTPDCPLAEWYVLELSSFQLETTSSLAPRAAVVLNVSEDHLDRYADMQAYADTKQRIFIGAAAQVLNREDGWCCAMGNTVKTASTVQWFGLNEPQGSQWGLVRHEGKLWLQQGPAAVMAVDELPLAGLHNAANALAALALCEAAGLPRQPLLAALRQFKGLPHRVEFVAERNGVRYYDDSKGTNVGATEAALKGMAGGNGKVVLIAGGDGKGQDFSPLCSAVAASCRQVLLIGRDGPQIGQAIAASGVPAVFAATLEEAVKLACQAALAGDAVLLSPACASFDMFRNYEHRAQVFIDSVRALPQEGC